MNAESPKKIVAIGGGAGLHSLLSGLQRLGGAELCAIITVADDGGSSGRLRKDFDIPPPGDIRRCLVALSAADPIIGRLFEYRFDESFLKGHSFGNLFIAVLTKLSGDFRQAIELAREILGVRGEVIPATDRKVVLVADHPDGSRSTGEQAIAHSGKQITRLRLLPRPPGISHEIAARIREADLVLLGPGSLYTSIMPNLLVPGMVEALEVAAAPVVFIANLMTQPGETDGFTLADHLEAFRRLPRPQRIDAVLVPEDGPTPEALARYRSMNSVPVVQDLDPSRGPWPRLLHGAFVASEDKVRHDPAELARAVMGLLHGRNRGVEAGR